VRVIGGEFRSRLLKSLPGLDVRPTPDRLREALFNVLAPRIEGAVFGDIYAGTGAVGIEALSRGAVRAIFVEQNRDAIGVIRANLKSLGLEGQGQILQAKAGAVLRALKADIVFIDPPYRLEREYSRALELLGANPPWLVIVQHDSHLTLPDSAGAVWRSRVLRQGGNALSFYEPNHE
jgi:16S rRNA (guanine(966)-N(2))-methyltransferase RsmD